MEKLTCRSCWRPTPAGSTPQVSRLVCLRRYQCIGYATFVDRLDGESGFARWFERLGREIDKLSDPAPGRIDRLIELQHALIHVIDFLDPEGQRFPKAHIKLLDPPMVARPGDNNDGHS